MAKRATTETIARETAESHGWGVSTRYSEGYADVRYWRGDETVRATFGPSGRIMSFDHLGARCVMLEFMNGADTGKRARLLTLLARPKN
jgi:hypothetical protein